jgi:hypothetical protein
LICPARHLANANRESTQVRGVEKGIRASTRFGFDTFGDSFNTQGFCAPKADELRGEAPLLR